MKTFVAFTTLALATSMTFACDAARDAAKEMVPLRVSGTLFVFKDGTMAKQDAYDNAKYIEKSDVLEAADGKKIPVTSNEVARMRALAVKGQADALRSFMPALALRRNDVKPREVLVLLCHKY